LKLKALYGFREVGGKFVDIGSGSGKAVFAAALLHKFDDCVGIEILEGLHNLAEEVCMCL
jgi:tRNA G46 methylase TrmB